MQNQSIIVSVSEEISYQLNPGQGVQFDFNFAEASFDRVSADLVISFDTGGKAILVDFFNPEEGESLPVLLLPDGTQIDAGAFLKSINPDMDISTAAGPSASSSSSGVGEYAGDAGELVGGVSRLGSQGTDYWTITRPVIENENGQNVLLGGDNSPTNPNPNPNPNPEPGQPYHTRLVVTDTSSNRFTFFAVDEDGNLVTDGTLLTTSFENGSLYFNVVGIDALTGKITVELTPAGLTALANGEKVGDMLIVNIDGAEYKMPLIINNSQGYDYQAEEATAGLGSDLKAEWYASDASPIISKSITLGGSDYNRVDIDNTSAASAVGAYNSSVDTSKSAKSDINITATAANVGNNAYGVETHGTSGEVSSLIKGGADSNIFIGAKTEDNHAHAHGVFNSVADGASKATTSIQGNNVHIKSESGNSDAFGMHATGTTYSTNGAVNLVKAGLGGVEVAVAAGGFAYGM